MNTPTRGVALVVGGGTGIGFACAERLARRGYALVLSGRRDAVLAAAAERVNAAVPGAQVVIAAGDGAKATEAEAVVQTAVDELGGINVCVNAAGIYEAVHFLDMTHDNWRRTVEANLDAQVFVSVAAAKAMSTRGGGRIILISATMAPFSEPDSAHYSAAKAGVSSLARSLAVDLSGHGITANAVAPGWIHTDSTDEFAREASPEALNRINLLGRLGQPDEVANLVEYLAIDAPAYLTGTTVFIDGGQTAKAHGP